MDEVKIQGMIAELEQQRNLLGTRAAQMAAEMAVLVKKVQDLEAELKAKDVTQE